MIAVNNFSGVWIPEAIWSSEDLSLTEKTIYAQIDSLDNGAGCYASNEYLAELNGISKRHIITIINKLIKKGYITKGGSKRNRHLFSAVKNNAKVNHSSLISEPQFTLKVNHSSPYNKDYNKGIIKEREHASVSAPSLDDILPYDIDNIGDTDDNIFYELLDESLEHSDAPEVHESSEDDMEWLKESLAILFDNDPEEFEQIIIELIDDVPDVEFAQALSETISETEQGNVLAEEPRGKKGAGKSKTARAPKKEKFKPPTVEEVREYCDDRGNGISAEAFCDFYTAKGWKIGKDSMKDWRAAVRTWEARDKQSKANGKRIKDNPTKNKFNNISKRDYDFNKLEQVFIEKLKRAAAE